MEQQAVNGWDGLDLEEAFATADGQVTQLPWDQATTSARFEDLTPVPASGRAGPPAGPG
ncbi:hypothetical protein [Streptomyces sp. NPDC014764]|uniref:hypothetical protein n=1 Tax=Streptomyces sp. NPDC014764 TaxID=3364907 RepID=UPI0036F98C63